MTQKEALDILKLGKNVFLTGPAGSGKTYVLNEYINYLKSKAISVAVTASTGIASTHIGGQTIHSWSGMGVRDFLTDYDVELMMQKQYLYKRFQETKVLVIDEISMMHSFRLDLLDFICKNFRGNSLPFGGMQVIFCGDFFQLPPVSRSESDLSEYAYNSNSWKEAGLIICYLSEQHRQNDDKHLYILNEIRSGNVTNKSIKLLESRLNKDPEVGIHPTKLHTHNIDVDLINMKHLDLISEKKYEYQMSWKGNKNLAEILMKSCLSPEKFVVKKGAKVMFTKNNLEAGYVNGTLGVISDFGPFGDPIVKTSNGEITASPQSWIIEEDGKIKAEISQIPLRLAWAITVHKSQGMSLDAMEVDLSKSFVKGMGYVALSRVRSLNGMKILGWNDISLKVSDEVLEKDFDFRKLSEKASIWLKSLSIDEIKRKQEIYIKSIEPDEKKKIKNKEKEMKKSTEEITADMLRMEISLSEMAKLRKLKKETIVSHIEKLLEEKRDLCPNFSYLRKEFKKSELSDILKAFEKSGTKTLSPVWNILDKQKKKPNYLKIRLARLFLSE